VRSPLVAFAVFVLLALAPSAGAAPSPARVETFELPSALVDTGTEGGALRHGRTIPIVNVLLPAGYDDRPRRRYPVLWLLHGATLGAEDWLESHGRILELAAGLKAIVVMPDGGTFGMYTDWWNEGERGGPAWIPYHLELLRGEIESRYRIRPERRWHAIAGVSMGGQGALRYAALLPGYFGSVVGFSSALPNIQAQEMVLGLNIAAAGGGLDANYVTIFGAVADPWAEGHSPQALASNYEHTRVYLTSGDGVNCPEDPEGPNVEFDAITELGINGQQVPFAEALRSAGADVTEVTTCGVHTFGVWHRAFPVARKWNFFKPVPKRPKQWTYRTILTSGEMWGFRFAFAEPPAAVAEFTRTGKTLAATGAGSVQIEGAPGCTLSAELPFELELPRICR
jgi:S-formylglutathione hydrolase FrmB